MGNSLFRNTTILNQCSREIGNATRSAPPCLGLQTELTIAALLPFPQQRLLPPYLNRPRFDGEMRTMERLIPELVALIRWMRDLVARNWSVSAAVVASPHDLSRTAR